MNAQKLYAVLFINKAKNNLVITSLIVASLIVTSLIFYVTDKALKDILIFRAQALATLLNKEQIVNLKGDSSDVLKPEYVDIKNQLAKLRNLDTRTRFIYLVKKTDAGVVFLVDSEPNDSTDYSPPGQVYTEASKQFADATTHGVSGLEIAQDRWGMWISSFAPVYDRDEKLIALVGLDVDYYTNYLLPIIGFSSIPVLAFLVLLVIVLYSKKLQIVEQEVMEEKEQLIHFASHEIGTPAAEAAWGCEALIDNPAIKDDEKAYLRSRQMYGSLMALLRRITNLLKSFELTQPNKIHVTEIDVIPMVSDLIIGTKKIAEAQGVTLHLVNPLPKKAITKGTVSFLQVVFSNLIAHGLYYTKEGKTMNLEYKETNGFHEFSATSTGDSLTKEEIETLFSAYYKGEPLSYHTEGIGLGLYVMQKIVKLFHGSINANSNETGVTITVSLPKV